MARLRLPFLAFCDKRLIRLFCFRFLLHFVSLTAHHHHHQERGGRGSRLVLCTDGLANVGLGALDDLKTVEEREIAEAFYEELGREVRLCLFVCVSAHEARQEPLGHAQIYVFSLHTPKSLCFATPVVGLHPEGMLEFVPDCLVPHALVHVFPPNLHRFALISARVPPILSSLPPTPRWPNSRPPTALRSTSSLWTATPATWKTWVRWPMFLGAQ